MHYFFKKPRHTRSMIAYMILTEYFWKFQWKTASWECCQCALLLQCREFRVVYGCKHITHDLVHFLH